MKPGDFRTVSADWLLARARDSGEGCLVWTLYSQKGNPKANGAGSVPFNVRHVVWQSLHGQPVGTRHVVICTCGTENCVEPAHLRRVPRSHLNRGRVQPLAERAKNAALARARSTTKPEAVADIRSSELTQDELAAKWGLSQAMVSRIQLHKNWKDYSNPFLLLGGA